MYFVKQESLMNANKIHQFSAHKGGNFSIMAALCALPVLAGLLVGIDYARFDILRSDVSEAVDSALVGMAGDIVRVKMSDEQQDQRAKDYLLANLTSVNAKDVTADFIREPSGNGKGFGIMRLHVKVQYAPISGPLAKFLPMKTLEPNQWVIEQ
jgi:Flp pilus assembly protein TadG